MRGRILVAAALIAFLAAGSAAFADEPKITIGGDVYMKYLWGNQRYDGSMYNFTTIPGEGFGDNGQGSEINLYISGRLSRAVEFKARIKSRFNQNQWTNFGGFGGSSDYDCIGGDCGEFDPRSNQYVKLRGVAITLTPGYKWVDRITIGSSDFGMFDPFVIGKIRYIDRDNASGLLFQGSAAGKKFTYDVTRISLPRLWAGPNFNTGLYTGDDAAWGAQVGWKVTDTFTLGGIFQYVYDQEIQNQCGSINDPFCDNNIDNGRDVTTRFNNRVWGAKFAWRPNATIDLSGAYYYSDYYSNPQANPDQPGGGNEQAPGSFFGLSGFSPVPAGSETDSAWKANLNVVDIGGSGVTLNFEVFDFGADYVSMMAARRESDVLLTEGHDGAWAFPGPANASFGVFSGNPTRLGYAGFMGHAVQVPTINVDNEFTDFDETMAETVTGWKGATLVPTWQTGALELAGELSWIDYNTNWQAFDSPTMPVSSSRYPVHELDTGVGHNFRSAYSPFQDKETLIALARFKYTIDAGSGIDLFGKIKYIDETDKRLNEERFLPFAPGDCPGGGVACANVTNPLDPGADTAGIYGNPPVITGAGGAVGYQWKPFDSISDDDRDLKYWLYQIGAGYQLTNDLYGTLMYELFDADLMDGNTAFQAYQLHEMASGSHKKNILGLGFRYILAGAEVGLQYRYAWGTFDPDFGTGFVPTVADEGTALAHNVPLGSLGFAGRFGGWNSLEKREFRQNQLKAFLKVQF
jgi:hypothetical protein